MVGSAVDAWLAGLDERLRSQADAVIQVVETAGVELERAVKWGRITYTAGGDWHHWLCGIAASKKGVRMVFHKGVLLEDPEGLLRGTGRYVREVSYEDAERRPDAVRALVRAAVGHQTDMLD